MFLAGSFIVLCGSSAQSTAQSAGSPYPSGQDSPMSMGHCRSLHVGQTSPYYGVTPVVSTYPSDHLDRNFRDAFRHGSLSGGISSFSEHIPLLNYVRPTGSNAGGSVGVLGKVISSIPLLNNILDIRVTNPQLSEIGLVQSYDFHRLYVTIPSGFDLRVNTSVVGSSLELSVKLDVTAEVYAVRDSYGRSRSVIGDCIYPPGSLRISLLNRLGPSQNLIDSLTDILTRVIPGSVQGVVCPSVNGVLSLLDVTLAHDVADASSRGVQFVIKT